MLNLFFYILVAGGKCSQQVELSGENINITYKPDGTHIAVGNRVCSMFIFQNFTLLLWWWLIFVCIKWKYAYEMLHIFYMLLSFLSSIANTHTRHHHHRGCYHPQLHQHMYAFPKFFANLEKNVSYTICNFMWKEYDAHVYMLRFYFSWRLIKMILISSFVLFRFTLKLMADLC